MLFLLSEEFEKEKKKIEREIEEDIKLIKLYSLGMSFLALMAAAGCAFLLYELVIFS